MPTYQYTCTECGEPLEAVQSFSDPALTICPRCGGRLRKVFSAVGVVFKGSGFYRTDSRTGSKDGRSGEKTSDGADRAAKDGKQPAAASSGASGTSSSTSSGGSQPSGSPSTGSSAG